MTIKKKLPKLTYEESVSFWRRVDMRNDDECWPWLGAKDVNGYGRFRTWGIATFHQAHRIAKMLHDGPFQKDLCVLHRCDNPICCNPAHLWLGTHLENVRDMVAKGRGVNPRGEQNGYCRHSDEFVRTVLTWMRDGRKTLSDAHRQFGVPVTTIHRWKTGKRRQCKLDGDA